MVKNITQNMTLREKLGQLIMMAFRFFKDDSLACDYIPVTKLNPTIKDLVSEYHLGGIVLFKENMHTPAQIVQLVEDIQAAANIPLLLGIDQEGGVVTRLQTGTNMPGNMALGAANDYALTREVAKTIGQELSVLGINLNFAPIVDVNSSPSNPIIGVRSFGSSPKLVGKMGKAFVEGLKEASVLSCLKHFPGHGNTVNDTHLELATIDYSYEELSRIDLKPFEMTIQAGAGADVVMIAHVIVPALDNTKLISKKGGRKIGTPATFSYKIITELLRNRLGFKGLVVTDALDMKAISDNFGTAEAVIKTILAGSDMAIMPVRIWRGKDVYKLEKLFVALKTECYNNPAFLARVEESAKRIISLKVKNNILESIHYSNQKTKPQSQIQLSEVRYKDSLASTIKKAEGIVGCSEHKEIERKASSKGVTLIKNDNKILPFKLVEHSKILVLDIVKPTFIAKDSISRLMLNFPEQPLKADRCKNGKTIRLRLFSDCIKQVSNNLDKSIIIDKKQINFADVLDESLRKQVLEANLIVLLTYNLDSSTTLPEQIANFADLNNKKLVSIACRNPYDIAYMPSSKANIAIYGAVGFDQTNAVQSKLTINLETATKVLFAHNGGKPLLNPTGKLPVTIKNPVTKEILYNIGHGLSYNN